MTTRRTVLAASLCALGASTRAWAATFPSGPVRLVHPFPGGLIDAAARPLADQLGTIWKQPVLVDSRPGASEMIAGEAVSKAPPDGQTLLMCTEATFVNNPALYRRMPFDPAVDLVPVSELYDIRFGLVVRSDLPVDTLPEFVALMKREGGKYSYASAGPGSALHLAMEGFRRTAGFEITHVPYKAISQVVQDMLGGRVDAWFASIPFVMPFVIDRKMKVLAVTGASRLKSAPQAPTFAEVGYADVDYRTTVALAAPRGTPADTVRRIQQDARTVMLSREYADRIAIPNELEVIANTPQQFAERLAVRRAATQRLIRSMNLQLD